MPLNINIEVLPKGSKNWKTIVSGERSLSNLGYHLGLIAMNHQLPIEIKIGVTNELLEKTSDG